MPDFSGSNPGQATSPAATPDELNNSGATQGLQPLSAASVFGSPSPAPASQVFGSSPTQGAPASQVFGSQSPTQPQSYAGAFAGGQIPVQSSTAGLPVQPQNLPKGLSDIPGGSLVKQCLSVLDKSSYPVRMHMVSEVAGAAALGLPGAQELYQKLNPNNEMFPDAHYRDVTDFMWDKVSQSMDPKMMLPYPNNGDFGRALIGVDKAMTGMAVDVVKDPLMYMGFGELTEGAQAIRKIGPEAASSLGVDYNTASNARNALTLRSPFTQTPEGINDFGVVLSGDQLKTGVQAVKLSAPVQVASKMMDSAAETQIGQKVIQGAQSMNPINIMGKVARYLSPDTGIADIDYALNTHSALSKGQDAGIIQSYVKNIARAGYTDEEAKVIQELGESVPNLRPNLPQDVIDSADGKLSASESDVRASAQSKLGDVAKKLGVTIGPGRDQAIIDGMVEAKKSDSRYLENLFRAGKLDASNIGGQVLENHLPHVMDPTHYGSTEADQAMQWVNKVSSKGITKERTLLGSVSDVNRQVEARFGVKSLFIEDPFVATATREARSQRLVRDTDLMRTVKNYGTLPTPEAKAAGMQPIQHSETEGLVFPKQISGKVSYYLGVQSPGNLEGGISQIAQALNRTPIGTQNRILRMQVFTAPGIWARNAVDNLGKGVIYGVGPDAWAATHAILNDSFEGTRAAPNLIRPQGKFYSGAELKKIFQDFGASKTTSFREGMNDFLGATKASLMDQARGVASSYATKAGEFAKGAMDFVSKYGEKAESFTRQAFLYQKIVKEGYEPAAAADMMTRVFFDYTRNSPATDAARFFMPFIQHPIKTALMAPEFLGKGAGYYNAVHNTFPAVLANMMSDPMHDQEFNQIAPDWLKQRDAIAGPMIAQNSWLSNIFGKSKNGGPVQSYLTPDLGMSILNTLKNPGLNPTFQALLNFTRGRQPDYLVNGIAVKGQEIPGSQKWNQLFWDTLRGSISMPNMERYIKQSFGLGNPQLYQPLTVHLMRAATSQFMGSTDLDSQAHSTLISLAHAYQDLQKGGSYQIKQEAQNALASPTSYSTYMNQKYGPVIPASNATIYADAKTKMGTDLNNIRGEQQKTGLAQAFGEGKLDAGEYRARLHNLEQQIDAVNKGYQLGMTRYLEMSKGAKSPEEARARSGVSLFGS